MIMVYKPKYFLKGSLSSFLHAIKQDSPSPGQADNKLRYCLISDDIQIVNINLRVDCSHVATLTGVVVSTLLRLTKCWLH